MVLAPFGVENEMLGVDKAVKSFITKDLFYGKEMESRLCKSS